MRLDKFLSVTGRATRSEAAKAARQGRVTVNGFAVKKADFNLDPEKDIVTFDGDIALLYKANYFCRTALRILWEMNSFSAAISITNPAT